PARNRASGGRSRAAAGSKHGRPELGESKRAVAAGGVLVPVHLAEALARSFRDEDGIVAEALVPTRRKAELAVDARLDHHGRAVRPGQGQRASEPGGAIVAAGLGQAL